MSSCSNTNDTKESNTVTDKLLVTEETYLGFKYGWDKETALRHIDSLYKSGIIKTMSNKINLDTSEYKCIGIFRTDDDICFETNLFFIKDSIYQSTNAYVLVQFYDNKFYSLMIKPQSSYKYEQDIKNMYYYKYKNNIITHINSKPQPYHFQYLLSVRNEVRNHYETQYELTEYHECSGEIDCIMFSNAFIDLVNIKHFYEETTYSEYDYNKVEKAHPFDRDLQIYYLKYYHQPLKRIEKNSSSFYIVYVDVDINNIFLDIEDQKLRKRIERENEVLRQQQYNDSIEQIKNKNQFLQQNI